MLRKQNKTKKGIIKIFAFSLLTDSNCCYIYTDIVVLIVSMLALIALYLRNVKMSFELTHLLVTITHSVCLKTGLYSLAILLPL